MSFKDIFKSSFLEGFSNVGITTDSVIVALILTCVLSAYIFLIYRLATRNTFYSLNFNIALAAISVITAGVILTIQASIVVSLGMVGALSIVRFRTAIKEPLDLVFLFWAISNGIICGAGMVEISIIVSIVVTIIILLLKKLPNTKSPKLLIINAANADVEDEIMEITQKYVKKPTVKSRTISGSSFNIVMELRISDDKALIREISAIEGVTSSSLLQHDGEAMFK